MMVVLGGRMRWPVRCAVGWTLGLAALAGGCDGEPDPPAASAAPAPFALRRLNRAEYNHTMRDLLRVTSTPADSFPPDDAADGFDNAAAALATSPLLVELWEQAAAGLAKEVLRRPLAAPVDLVVEGESGQIVAGEEGCNQPSGAGFALWCGGAARLVWTAPAAGVYRVTATATSTAAGEEDALVSLLADGVGASGAAVPAGGPVDVVIEATLSAGPHELLFSFDNDFYDELAGADRNVYLDRLRVEGPLDFVYTPNPAHDAVFVCEPEGSAEAARACARRIIEALLPRAWRRPVTPDEVDGLMPLYDEVVAAGDPAEWGVEFMLRAVLTSPQLLFLVEEPASAADEPVGAFELASRLSYFLWEAPPDDALWALALDGTLRDPAVLAEQVRRMLRDPKAVALTADFAGQWLGMRMVSQAEPDVNVYPAYNVALRDAMRDEMDRMFQTFVGTDRDLVELMDAEWTEIDATLAGFYGFDFTRSRGTQQFNVRSAHRGGWLGQAGILMATSYPTRTTPVRRGTWVLGNLLCDEPDPPPPNVPGFPDVSPDAATVRERLEAHRAVAACAACHDSIDPVGLALEHFDGLGAWREEDNGVPVDASGVLPGGVKVDGLDELSAAIARDPRFTTCLVDKAFTWAHHRPPADGDRASLNAAHAAFLAGGRTLDALVTALVTSPSFQARGVAP